MKTKLKKAFGAVSCLATALALACSARADVIYDFTGKVGTTDGTSGISKGVYTANVSTKFGSSNDFLIIYPKSGETFKAGDTVEVTGYHDSGSTPQCGVKIKTAMNGDEVFSDYVNPATRKQTYTFTGTLNLKNDASELYVYRNSGGTVYVTGIKISRAAAAEAQTIGYSVTTPAHATAAVYTNEVNETCRLAADDVIEENGKALVVYTADPNEECYFANGAQAVTNVLDTSVDPAVDTNYPGDAILAVASVLKVAAIESDGCTLATPAVFIGGRTIPQNSDGTYSVVQGVAARVVYTAVDGYVFPPEGDSTYTLVVTPTEESAAAEVPWEMWPIAASPNFDCLTFSSAKPFTLAMTDAAKHWNGTLWWSKNTITWKEWNGEALAAEDAQTDGSYALYLRGDANNTVITGSTDPYYGFTLTPSGTATIDCTGNLETLRGATGTDPSPTAMAQSCYAGLFRSCTALTTAPALPATALAKSCYNRLFYGCSALTNAPACPAQVVLAEDACNSMYGSCKALTTPPALPAVQLAKKCYTYMFDGCVRLASVPELPATAMAEQCYEYMFRKCTALQDVVDLGHVTVVAAKCFRHMYENCTAVKVYTAQQTKHDHVWKVTAAETAATDWNDTMLSGTGGTFTDNPELGATYYVTCPPQHVYVETAVTKSPTCTEKGRHTCQCTICGDVKEEELPALGHQWGAWTGETAATCTESGSRTHNCQLCGKGESETIPALGHQWGAWTGETAATCTQTGSRSHSCQLCGDSESETIPALGHLWGTWYVVKETMNEHACERCQATETKLGEGVVASVDNGACTITGAVEITAAYVAMLSDRAITNLVLGAGVTGIGSGAFTGMRSLRDVTIGADCTEIGSQAFVKCQNVTNFTCLATKPPTVGAHAFYRCNSLEKMTFAAMPTWGKDAFTFMSGIYMKDGLPVVYAMPTVEIAGYVQKLKGSTDLQTWQDVDATNKKDFQFFKIVLEAK